MTAEDLLAWQQRMAELYGDRYWTQERAARELGYALRTYQDFAAGRRNIPQRFELACEGAEYRARNTLLRRHT